jgi:hypothetical protein
MPVLQNVEFMYVATQVQMGCVSSASLSDYVSCNLVKVWHTSHLHQEESGSYRLH